MEKGIIQWMLWTKLEAGSDTDLLYPLFLTGRRLSVFMRDVAREWWHWWPLMTNHNLSADLLMASGLGGLCHREQTVNKIAQPATSHALTRSQPCCGQLLGLCLLSTLSSWFVPLIRDATSDVGIFLSLAHFFLRSSPEDWGSGDHSFTALD